MKTKMTLMIFYPDGRSKNIPFNFHSLVKGAAGMFGLLVLLALGLTSYNTLRFSWEKSEYDETTQKISAEERSMMQRLKNLENIEEKISFFLGGALFRRERGNLPMNKLDYGGGIGGGIGGGDEAEVENSGTADIPAAPIIPEGQEQEHEELFDSSDIDLRLDILSDRLEKLANLAVREKTRLDYTPSIFPAPGYIVSGFGWRRSPFTGNRELHRGIDLVNEIGTPIKAAASGQVIFAGREAFWGNAVFIEHKDGVVSKYGHMNSFNVKTGDAVTRGQVIGYLGITGRTTGPHVHYQIEIDGQVVNPTQFIIDESESN